MSTMKKFERFSSLTQAEKIEARISWLERKMVEVLWISISLTSAAIGAFTVWLSSELMDVQSAWLRASVFIVAWGVAGWLLKRSAFRGSPPHIDLM